MSGFDLFDAIDDPNSGSASGSNQPSRPGQSGGAGPWGGDQSGGAGSWPGGQSGDGGMWPGAPGGGSNPAPGGWPSTAPGPAPGGWPSPAPGSEPGGWPSTAPGPAPGGWPSPAPGPAPGGWPSPAPGPAPGGWPSPAPGSEPGGWPSPARGPAPGPESGGGPKPRRSSNQSLSVPYRLNLRNGVHDRLVISIKGVVKPNANKVTLDLCSKEDIAFHFNPRFNEGGQQVIVRNSCQGKKWGSEERNLGNFPFARGKPFEMEILCTSSEFKVSVNHSPVLTFKHRVTDLRSINILNIYNDLDLVSVDQRTQ